MCAASRRPARKESNLEAAKGEVMGWRVILTTFGVTFLAELGDKTRLAAITLSAQTKRPWEVFIGASLALVCL